MNLKSSTVLGLRKFRLFFSEEMLMHTLIDPIMADQGELEFMGLKPDYSTPVIRKKFRPAEDILDQVMAYQNADVVARLQRELNLTEEEANLLFDDTKRFLYLTATYPGKWSPPKQVDKGWHEFLMFTRDYAQFCQSCFDRFIHHEPNRIGEPSTGGSQTRNAILAARELFGELSSNWDINGKAFFGSVSPEMNVDDCGNCGSGGAFCS